MLSKLRNRLIISGVTLTWLVGGLVAILGYRQMTLAVRREALARVETAVRVGQRLIEDEFIRMDSAGPLPLG